ncbi:hypothetical protein D3C81_1892530 [compost metagenome]
MFASRLDQVGALSRGIGQRLLAPPFLDLGVMAPEQYLGHPHAFIFFRPRVVRTIQQAVDEAVLHRGLRVAQHAGQVAHHRVDQRHRRQLAA